MVESSKDLIWAAARQNKQNDMCTQQRHRSAWAKINQTEWMPRLIGVFSGHTGHFVGFVKLWHENEIFIFLPPLNQRLIVQACLYFLLYVVHCQHFQTSSSLKPQGRFKPNFMWSLHGMEEQNFVQMVQVTWPRWPLCPYMVKNFKNLLLWNQKADDLETWYAASSTQVLPSLFEWWPLVDLDLVYGKVKFDHLRFCMGKGKTMDSSETIVVCDIEVGRCRQLYEYMNLYKCRRSRSFIDLGPRSLSFNIFKLLFLRNR